MEMQHTLANYEDRFSGFVLTMKQIVHRCGASGSMRACHAAGPGSIPGRDKFPG